MPDIAIWSRCNNHCLMCSNPAIFQQESTHPYSLESLINRWSEREISLEEPINLTGGEPTIHPDFFKVIDYFRSSHPNNRIVIASNGRIFFYEKFVKQFFSYDNSLLEIAIHGYDEKSHDAVTCIKGSFKQTVQGIHNILRLKNKTQELEIRIVLTKMTIDKLDKILSFISKEFDINKISNIPLMFLEMEGQAIDNIATVGLTYTEAAKYLPKIMEKWSPKIKNLRLYHFPLCTLPPKLWPYIWRTLRGDEVKYIARCKKCFVKEYCLGVHRNYLTQVGNKEFVPQKKIGLKTNDSYCNPIEKVQI